jgi:heat-inducible transcriptional repressor
MLDERKAAILRAVVEEYIETAQPVGSNHVARSERVNVSSATVRNEMAVLEQEGYLHQPHTSAGRVPTDRGYRFFVDSLGRGSGRLANAQNHEIRTFFETSHGALETMLLDTSRLLANLTNYASVVVGPQHEAARLRSVQLVAMNSHTVLLVAVLSDAALERHTLEAPFDCTDEIVATATTRLATHLLGSPLSDLPVIAATDDSRVNTLVDAARDALDEAGRSHTGDVFVGGTARMAAAFDAVETVRDVLATLERQYVVVTLLRDVVDGGLSVSIGSEHGIEPLAACSVVVSPYLVDGQYVGSVGVLGPTRMNYAQALAAVEAVSQRLGRRLSDG